MISIGLSFDNNEDYEEEIEAVTKSNEVSDNSKSKTKTKQKKNSRSKTPITQERFVEFTEADIIELRNYILAQGDKLSGLDLLFHIGSHIFNKHNKEFSVNDIKEAHEQLVLSGVASPLKTQDSVASTLRKLVSDQGDKLFERTPAGNYTISLAGKVRLSNDKSK